MSEPINPYTQLRHRIRQRYGAVAVESSAEFLAGYAQGRIVDMRFKYWANEADIAINRGAQYAWGFYAGLMNEDISL
jgi:hypothetical protein